MNMITRVCTIQINTKCDVISYCMHTRVNSVSLIFLFFPTRILAAYKQMVCTLARLLKSGCSRSCVCTAGMRKVCIQYVYAIIYIYTRVLGRNYW